jgi:hypothetical protein
MCTHNFLIIVLIKKSILELLKRAAWPIWGRPGRAASGRAKKQASKIIFLNSSKQRLNSNYYFLEEVISQSRWLGWSSQISTIFINSIIIIHFYKIKYKRILLLKINIYYQHTPQYKTSVPKYKILFRFLYQHILH